MKLTNNVLLILIIVVVGGGWAGAMIFIGQQGGAVIDRKQLNAEVEQRLSEHASAIETEVTQLAAETIPPLSHAFYEQARTDYPHYLKKISEEGGEFLDNLEDLWLRAVQEQYRDFLRKHRHVLAEEFPDHADQESVNQLVAEFERVTDKMIDRYYLEEFQQEGQKTAELWARFQPLDPLGEGEPSLEQQLVDYVADWSVLAFTEQAREQLGTR